jgi:hypothetical protein
VKLKVLINNFGRNDLQSSIFDVPKEIFGEFPPRQSLNDYTRFPVVVPSSNPSYDTQYNPDYLKSQEVKKRYNKSSKDLMLAVKDDAVRGYCVVLCEYLRDATHKNPKTGFGKNRTSLWGLQRPPLGSITVIRCETEASWDRICPIYLLFQMTNARSQAELSIDSGNTTVIEICQAHNLPYTVETDEEMVKRIETKKEPLFNTVRVDGRPFNTFPAVGNFVSLYFPLGHIKSTQPNDIQFHTLADTSPKWLCTLF